MIFSHVLYQLSYLARCISAPSDPSTKNPRCCRGAGGRRFGAIRAAAFRRMLLPIAGQESQPSLHSGGGI
jgi:hypothetical protein